MSLGVPNHASFSVSTDDGREIDMHGMFFAPHNLELYKAYYGSEEVARAELQGLWDEFCKQPKFIGLKPKPRTCSPDVQVHTLFDAYAVRIWGVGLDFLQAYHFDFVDPHSGNPVNLPPRLEDPRCTWDSDSLDFSPGAPHDGDDVDGSGLWTTAP